MRDPLRRATGSVRVRVTVAATLLVCIVLVVAAALLTWAVERKLVADNEADTATAVGAVASDFEAGRPFTIPLGVAGSGTAVAIYSPAGEPIDGVDVGMIDALGPIPNQLIAGTTGVAGSAPLVVTSTISDDATIAMRAARFGDGTYYVVGVSPLDSVRQSVRTMGHNLRMGIPAIAALFAVVAWYLTGRALRPVESIRGEVEEISASTLDRRVAVPPTHDEVARLATTMNAMLDRLHDARDRERQFIADASHELRSPLASLRSQLETDAGRPLDPEVGADLDRLQHVIDDLVDLARATDAPLPQSEVDLDEVVLTEVAAVHHGDVTIDVSEVRPVKVVGSGAALGRMTRNLLDNAVRHANGRVAVALGNGGADVVLVVDDDGSGIDPDHRQLVFDRFARLDDGRARADGGVGLGLAVVKATAERHGGHVACDNAELGGARFTVTLPATPA